MALSMSTPPGRIETDQTLTWNTTNETVVSYSVNGYQPLMPTHALADTTGRPWACEWSNGYNRLFADTGFGRYYNRDNRRPEGAPLIEHKPGTRFLYNGLRRLVNQQKIASGLNKILVLGAGSGPSGDNATYRVDDATNDNGFAIAYNVAIALLECEPVVVAVNPTTPVIDLDFEEIRDYAAIMLYDGFYRRVGMDIPNGRAITDKTVAAIDQYLLHEGGIYIVMDSGASATLEEVIDPPESATSAWYWVGNRILSLYGVRNVTDNDRTGLTISQIVSASAPYPTPHLEGMLGVENGELVFDDSEGVLLAAPYQHQVPIANLPEITTSGDSTLIQAVGRVDYDTVTVFRGLYTKPGATEPFDVKDSPGGEALQSIDVFYSPTLLPFAVESAVPASGRMLLDTTLLGYWRATQTGLADLTWLSGGPETVRVNNRQSLSIVRDLPAQHERVYAVQRFQPDIAASYAIGTVLGKLAQPSDTTLNVLGRALTRAGSFSPNLFSPVEYITSDIVGKLGRYFDPNRPANTYSIVSLPIYATDAALSDNLSSTSPVLEIGQELTNSARFIENTYYPQGSAFPTPADGWSWDSQTNALVSASEERVLSGILFQRSVENYVFETIVSSDSSSSELAGIVLSSNVTEPDTIDHLVLFISPRQRTNEATTVSVWYNWGNRGAQGTRLLALSYQTADDLGWNGRRMRVRVSRYGSAFKIQTSLWNVLTFDEGGEINFRMDNYPDLAQFRHPKPYGFLNFALEDVRYSNIRHSNGVSERLAISAESGSCYRYTGRYWQPMGDQMPNLADLFGAGRVLESTVDGKRYTVQNDGTLLENT